MNIDRIREMVQRLGVQAAIKEVARRAANRVTEVRIFRSIRLTMDTVDPSFLVQDAGYRWGFVDGPTLLRALEHTPGTNLDAAFVEETIGRGDHCYAAMDGSTIASYGWYSTQPTPMTAIADDVMFHFDGSLTYLYRGYTLPAHRGKRLHGIGMARAMRAQVERGKEGIVACVELSNVASLMSCYAAGCRDVGEIYCLRVKGLCFSYATQGCHEYGLCMKQAGGST